MSLASLRHWLKRARERLWRATRHLRNLRERFPGDQKKAKKKDVKKEVARREQAKEQLAERVKRKRKWLDEHDDPKPPASGVGTFDGKPCAAWMIPWLQKSRANGWNGILVSGWRDPIYSEQLCYAICGAPSCPGRCAGRASNHSGSVYPAGAVDVSDYANFGQIQRRIGSPLINALGAQDPVHFSVSGR